MAYKARFYCIQNMIGYTGDIHNFPTVYFLKQVAGGSFYGHITQKHDLPGNVGRMHVSGRPDPHYTIGNQMINGVLKMVERGSGWVHESRSSLTTLRHMSANDIAICAQAIWRCQHEKYISEFNQSDLDKIAAQMQLKAAITPAALMAKKNQIGAAADARRRQARDNQIAGFNHLLHRGDLARRRRGY